jgi:hypothetical protein
MNQIALFLQDSTKLCSFFECNSFVIYQKGQQGWDIGPTIHFDPIGLLSPRVMRQAVEQLLPLLSDCKVIAGLELSGIPFLVFDRAGFDIFSTETINHAVFDGILADIESNTVELDINEKVIKNLCPVETDVPGVYFLDLIALQTRCPEFSSKQVLMNFFQDTPFLELRLICKHIPPWLENSGNYDIFQEKQEDCINAIIVKKQCYT